MKRNISNKDRLLRITIALGLLGYAFWQESWLAFAAALFTFFEVYMSWCMFYALIGKNSCPIDRAK